MGNAVVYRQALSKAIEYKKFTFNSKLVNYFYNPKQRVISHPPLLKDLISLPSEMPPKRGRPAKTVVAKPQESSSEEEAPAVEEPVRKRGRKPIIAKPHKNSSSEEEAPPPKRGKKVAIVEPQNSSSEEDSSATEEAPPKRGRKAATPESESSSSSENEEEPEEQKKPDRKLRGDKSKNGVAKEEKRVTRRPRATATATATASEKKEPSDESDKDNSNAATQLKKKDKPEAKLLNQTETDLESIDYDCKKVNGKGEMYNMKICSWNVSGLRAVIKKNGLDYIIKEDADIVALQETKCDKDKLPSEVKLRGYKYYYLDSERSGYCGVALYTKQEPISVKYGLKKSDCNAEGRIITAEYEDFYLINVYVPNAGPKLVTLAKKLKWNEAFKNYVMDLDAKKPVIICGDMNVAHAEIDLTNPKTNTKNAGFTPQEREGMTDLLASGFVDTYRQLYPDTIGAYTFWSYFAHSRKKNIGWRLDYYIVSERIKDLICDNVMRSSVYGSDHCPIVLYAHL